MSNAKLRLALCLASICLVESSPLLFDFQPAKFARERFERSRNRTNTGNGGRGIRPLIGGPEVLDFVAIVEQHGYPAEEHLVTTADGYRLRIHRIPGSPTRRRAEGKPIAFFQHGLLASSDTWVLNGPNKDLAFMLADAGFDVWLGNVRGNTYSRLHTRLRPDYDPEFWQFSFHEIGLYDIPAVIDYMLQVTKQRSITYIGHSMGTTISYAMLSTRPEYNSRVDLVISLAPVAFWHAPPRPFIKFLMDNSATIKNFVTNARIYELFPLTAANAQLAQTTCSDKSVFQELCINFFYYVSGYNPRQLNTTGIPYALSYFPAGVSAQALIHYSQNMLLGDFKMFDYGTIQNLAIYRQTSPPSYNINNIITPVALIYGGGDSIVAPGNVIELSKRLPNLLTVEAVPDERFSHLDFLFAKDLKTLLNDRLMEITMKFSRGFKTV